MAKSSVNQGLYPGKQISAVQVGAGFTVREVPALPRPGLMDGAASSHFRVAQKNTGTVRLYHKGIPAFDISLPHLAIRDFKMTGDPIYIGGIEKERGAFEPVTAVSWTVVAVDRGIRPAALLRIGKFSHRIDLPAPNGAAWNRERL